MPQRCQRLQPCGSSPDDVVVESVLVVSEAGSAVDFCSATTGVMGSVSAVGEVKTGSVLLALVSATAVVVESVSATGEVKIGSRFGVGRSLIVVKSISLSLMSSLGLFEQTLTITTTTATNTSTSTVIATVVTVAVVVVFIEVIVVVVVLVIKIVGVVAEFMEEVMAVEVVVVAAVVELDVHGVFDIDPEESVNMSFFVALESTQETPQSTC